MKKLGPFILVLLSLCHGGGVSARAAEAANDPRLSPVVLAYRKTMPAVVNISSQKLARARFNLFGRDPFDDIFDDIFSSPLFRQVPVQSLGSGFLIHPEGYIITNAHVVRRAHKITVTLAEGSQHEALAISSDPRHDLAVVKIGPPAGRELPFLPLGRSDDLMVGETVIAIGNSMGYASSLTTGVISAVGRTLSFRDDVTIRGLIQTDAPINPGNSGGPLLNIKGELIGINTAIRADAQNIGFAIPIDRLAEELPHLLDFESINRVVFGAAVQQRHGPDADELVVTDVRGGTPADGKLRLGDRIVAVEGKAMRQITDFTCTMLAIPPNTAVGLACIRDGRQMSVDVVIAPKPLPEGNVLARRLFGLTLRPLDPGLARQLDLSIGYGLLVVGVDAGSPADRLGVKLKDVLFQVGRFYVTDLEALGMTLEDVKPGQEVRIGIIRDNSRPVWVSIAAESQ